MAHQTVARNYEFSPEQDAEFRRLAGAVSFVGAAMMAPGAVLVVVPAYLFVAHGPSVPQGLVAVLGVLLMVMGINLLGAARHFNRIAGTDGHDIENLMIAMGEVARVYGIQRWLWIALGLVLIVAVATRTRSLLAHQQCQITWLSDTWKLVLIFLSSAPRTVRNLLPAP